MEEAGIKYRTEKKWTAAWLQSDFYRARLPLKGYARGRRARMPATIPAPPAPVLIEAALVQSVERATIPQSEADEPEFKFAQFIDWDERRRRDNADTRLPDPPPVPSQHYIEVMEQLTGKKPAD